MKELYLLLEKTIMIRRLKSDVLTQLPPKIRESISVVLSDQHRKVLSTAMKDLSKASRQSRSKNEKQAKAARSETLSLVNELFRLSGTAKISGIIEYMESQLENLESKFIIFAYHQNVIQSIQYRLKEMKLDFILIDGKTKQSRRHELVNHFQTKDHCRVAVLSILAAGCGITLTAASQVIFAELYWNPGHILQAEDRAHRIGQRNSVLITFLLGKDTFDEHIWDLINNKLTILGETLDNKSNNAIHLDNAEEDEIQCGEIVATDDTSEYSGFIDQILDRISEYPERVANRAKRRAEKELELEREQEEPKREKSTYPRRNDTIILHMDDDEIPSTAEQNNYHSSHIPEYQRGGDGKAKLTDYGFQGKRK